MPCYVRYALHILVRNGMYLVCLEKWYVLYLFEGIDWYWYVSICIGLNHSIEFMVCIVLVSMLHNGLYWKTSVHDDMYW